MALRVEHRYAQGNERAVRLPVLRRHALHCGEHAAGPHEMPARGDEFAERRKGARDDEIEKRLRPPGLDSSLMHFDIVETELDRGLAQERRFLLAGLRECHMPARSRDGERNAGQAGARPGIRPPKTMPFRFCASHRSRRASYSLWPMRSRRRSGSTHTSMP